MYTKIYFNDKPLFLCDAVDDTIKPYQHDANTVFKDRFSIPAINDMIREMEQPDIQAGVFLHSNLEELKQVFWNKFTIVRAGGGLVKNPHKAVLMIFRRGKWDLPKGKLDKGETIEECALREVEEETGLNKLTLHGHLVTTYHSYHERGRFILKENYWYNMSISNEQLLVPQAEEQITEARWVEPALLAGLLGNTFSSVKDVLQAGGL